jgi:2-oxoglutarate dehydrogenase E2 component (dihydrolipoamide succinyltransferase)
LATSDEIKLRVLIAERRASAHSELSRRLDRVGHEVLARVTSGQGALDYAELLRPDVVLIAPMLEDGPGVMAAISLTRELPGIAAVVLTAHPAARDRAARPNWGAVTLVPADAEPADLDAELRRAVEQARDAMAMDLSPESRPASERARPADLAPEVEPTPQYETPVAPANVVVPQLQATVVASAPAPVRASAPPAPATAAGNGHRPVSFTDDDLLGIGPALDAPVAPVPQAVPAPAPAPAAPAAPRNDSDTEIIAEAAECLLERTGLSRADAMRLMEQEAADTGQRLVDVAQAVLGRDTGAAA